MPKFASTFKSLLCNKEKLFELENNPLNENCSVVLLKKLPEKLRDPDKFLIPFGVAEDVIVKVGKFHFLADFVVVDYDVDPRVPLILERPFLRTARALVDVFGEELILRDGDEKLIFHADNTSKHPQMHANESINMINFIDITCEDRFPEVLKKSTHPSSGSTTPLSNSIPSLTPVETSDSLLEEFADELALLDPFPLKLVMPTLIRRETFFYLRRGNSVIFSNPLFGANDDFTSSDDESLPEEDWHKSSLNEVLEDIENKDSYVSNLDEPALLVTPLSDANKDECFDPGGDIDEIDAFLDIDVSMDIKDNYHDSEGDIIYLKCLLINDTTHNLPPEEFLDHNPKSLKDESNIDDLKI
ncbi:reverse transcriptase domain-containing protein [Tanacetum coccineum]